MAIWMLQLVKIQLFQVTWHSGNQFESRDAERLWPDCLLETCWCNSWHTLLDISLCLDTVNIDLCYIQLPSLLLLRCSSSSLSPLPPKDTSHCLKPFHFHATSKRHRCQPCSGRAVAALPNTMPEPQWTFKDGEVNRSLFEHILLNHGVLKLHGNVRWTGGKEPENDSPILCNGKNTWNFKFMQLLQKWCWPIPVVNGHVFENNSGWLIIGG